jgi:hypothetical protein
LAKHKILLLVKLIGQPIGAVKEKTEEGVGRLLSKKERRKEECQAGGRRIIIGTIFVIMGMTLRSFS